MYVDNGFKAKKAYENKYSNKYVSNWKGAFIKYTNTPSYLEHAHSLHIFLKMIPTDSVGDYPDVILTTTKNEESGYID